MEVFENLQEPSINEKTREVAATSVVNDQSYQTSIQNVYGVNDTINEREMAQSAHLTQLEEPGKIRSRLLQLRFLMEDHLEENYYNPQYHFGYFLGQYIDRIGMKHKVFAQAINLLPTELSQIVNHHRRPKDKLAFRLDIHSGGSFPALLWFKIIQKDRHYELFHDDSWLQSEKEFVNAIKDPF